MAYSESAQKPEKIEARNMHPVLFHVGSISVYSYGFCAAFAVLAVAVMAYGWAPKAGLSRTLALDVLFLLFVSGLAGARLWYVAQHWLEFSAKPLSMLWIQEGGLVWYGGFFMALFCGTIFAKIHKMPFFKWADFIAPLLALAHGIGRIGCYMNGCCYGHFFGAPTQLVESAALMALSFFLFYLWGRRSFDGQVVWAYVFFYSLTRFMIEFSREDQVISNGLSVAQWTSLILWVVAAGVYPVLSRSARRSQNTK